MTKKLLVGKTFAFRQKSVKVLYYGNFVIYSNNYNFEIKVKRCWTVDSDVGTIHSELDDKNDLQSVMHECNKKTQSGMDMDVR